MSESKIGPKEQQRRDMRVARAERNERPNFKPPKKPSTSDLRKQMAKVNKPNVRPTGRGR